MSQSKSTRLAILVSCLVIILASTRIARSETSGRIRNATDRLFVANTDNTVSVFPIGKFGNVPSLITYTQLSRPNGIARDRAGNIYVANSGSNAITIYRKGASGSAKPFATIEGSKTGLNKPMGVALDAKGNIYVVNAKGGNSRKGSVTVYPSGSNGNVNPTAAIAGGNTELDQPIGLDLDSKGNIYVVNQAGFAGSGSVTVYSARSTGNVAPTSKIAGKDSGISTPAGITLDAACNIYVTNNSMQGGAGTVEIFRRGSAGNVAPASTIEGSCSGLDSPKGIAVGSHGNIYVANSGAIPESPSIDITVYAAGSAGCVTPIAIICGEATGLSQPAGLTLDSKSRIYVSDTYASSVSAFAPLTAQLAAAQTTPSAGASRNVNEGQVYFGRSTGATLGSQSSNSLGCTALTASQGNVAPIKAIVSPDTEMDHPSGIALDRSGKIYVVNTGGQYRGSDSISVYPAGSDANVSPIATIEKDLESPTSIAVDAEGDLHVANATGGSDGNGSVTIYSTNREGKLGVARTIGGAKTGLNVPVSIAIDSAGYLYVLNSSGGPDSSGSVTIYEPHSNGDVAPVRTIINSDPDHPDFDNPAGLALDGGNNIYVANQGSADSYSTKEDIAALAASITIYTAGSNGKVSPRATIKGNLTQLDMPSGIAVDSIGNIFVTNDAAGGRFPLDFISVYPPHSSGNVAPAMRMRDGRIIRHAVIKGSRTGLDQPAGMAIGPD